MKDRTGFEWYDIQIMTRLNPLNWYWKPRWDATKSWHSLDFLFFTVLVLHG